LRHRGHGLLKRPLPDHLVVLLRRRGREVFGHPCVLAETTAAGIRGYVFERPAAHRA
jgi:hypothetical protein